MASFRDIKRKMRRDLHERMKVAAAYVPVTGAPVLLHVRDHTKFVVNAIEGGVRSGSGQMAGRHQALPSIVFMLDEVAAQGITLVRNAIVSIDTNEAYRLEVSHAPDDISVKWSVKQITDLSELAALPHPSTLEVDDG